MAEPAEEDHVLYGVVDEKIPATKSSFSVNKVGGEPDFDGDVIFRGNPSCGICGKCQALVVQVYCPLDDSPYHRTLYVFSCINSSCWSKSCGWTVLRMLQINLATKSERKEEEMLESRKPTKSTGANNTTESWGGGDDDWGDEAESALDEQREEQIVSVLSNEMERITVMDSCLDNAHNNLDLTIPGDTHVFESHYINVFEESECALWSKTSKIPNISSFTGIEDDDHSKFGEGCKLKSESYERTNHADEIFHKFWKKSLICPNQIIRYSHCGKPLHARKFDGKVPHCLCGAPRVFEMQLMPALLPYLILHNVSIEFSSVLVYTCSANCLRQNDLSIIEEYVIYQDDPDLSYFKGQKS